MKWQMMDGRVPLLGSDPTGDEVNGGPEEVEAEVKLGSKTLIESPE